MFKPANLPSPVWKAFRSLLSGLSKRLQSRLCSWPQDHVSLDRRWSDKTGGWLEEPVPWQRGLLGPDAPLKEAEARSGALTRQDPQGLLDKDAVRPGLKRSY